MAHGLNDEMIGIERALSSRDALEALGYAVAWHEYPMAHAVCEEEVTAIAGWLAGAL
jgi:phospholipase/carboxylesterase